MTVLDGVDTPASAARLPSEWLAALTIVVVAGIIRVALGSAVLTPVALAGLLPLVLIYCMMGAFRRLSAEQRSVVGGGVRRIAIVAFLLLAFLPFPLLLASGGQGFSGGASDGGLGLGLGGYFIALLESGQLYVWLSRLSRSSSPDRSAARRSPV